MELKSYTEGFLRRWWFVLLMVLLALYTGRQIANAQATQYTASAVVGINAQLLANYSDPTNVLQLGIPLSYQSRIESPAILKVIIKHYLRITPQQLAKDILVSTDAENQLALINVTDTDPAAAQDIANYMAASFVNAQNAEIVRQVNYYQSFLQQKIPQLTNEINNLNNQLQQITPQKKGGTKQPVTPTTRRQIVTDQYQLDLDTRTLYNYQLASQNIQNTYALFPQAFVLLQPANAANTLIIPPVLPTALIIALAILAGLVIAIVVIVIVDYFTPFLRHKGEIQRIVGLPVLAELPGIFGFEQRRLLQSQPILFRWRMNALRLFCGAIGAPAIRQKGYTVLLTSPRKRRGLAAVLATFLAHSGFKTLLIDAHFKHPILHEQIKRVGTSEMITSKGRLLSFVFKAKQINLFFLPGNAMLAQNRPAKSQDVLELLPELQEIFDIIIIDAPSLEAADTHMLATHVHQAYLLVKKRRDTLKTVQTASIRCDALKLKVQSLLLG